MAVITAKIRLDGEAEFRRGMTEATKVTKSLDSQLKLAEETFKETGDAETYMKQKSDLLQAKLESQKHQQELPQNPDAEMSAQRIGLSPSLMRHYKGGDTYISDNQAKRIEAGLHQIARELLSVTL